MGKIENVTYSAPVESIRRRYFATIFTQFMQLAASLLTAGMAPRALGPASYGSYNFLLSTAATIQSFLDPSASQAFFTFSSQDRRSGSLTRLYTLLLLGQIAVILTGIVVMSSLGITDWLWPGETVDKIVLVTTLGWLLLVVASLRQLGDSKGLTVRTQAMTLMIAVINVVGLLSLNAFDVLNFYTYAWLNVFTAILIGLLLVYWLLVVNHDLCWDGSWFARAWEYIQRWWRFSSPLILLEYYKPLVAYLSTYLLQRWYGSVEQGLFALAFRWSALVLVFTSSALSIFWREIAHAVANGEHERAMRVYLRFTRMLFFLAFVLCTWLSFSGHFLIEIMAGYQYELAIPILAIMAYYPLQQTYGQLNTAALKGSEKTIAIRNLGILISIPDVLLSYFLLASPDAPIPGLGLGALGVAIRMVGYGLLSVQAYEWMSHKTFGLSYFNTLVQKLGTAFVVVICAGLTLWGVSSILVSARLANIWALGISSAAYFALVAVITLIRPDLAGLSRTEVLNDLQQGRNLVFRLFSREKRER
jgi:O-antigen/teichoic acid export membrane protein